MIRNYLLSAFRNIRRNLSFTFLNVTGLALSVFSCLVIYLVVRNELGFDNHTSKANRTYRVTLNALDFNSNTSLAVMPAIRNDFPELENSTQTFYRREGQIKIGEKRFVEKDLLFADSQYSKIFEPHWTEGNPTTALSEPNSTVLTESVAKKYFETGAAIGKTLVLNNEYTLKVTGIVKDPPANTSLPYRFLISFKTLKFNDEMFREFYDIPGGSYSFIVIPENYSIHSLEKKIPWFLKKNWGADIAKEAHLPMQPLRDIHFDQRYINNIITPVAKNTYFGLAVIAVFIIVMACINFINLSTAQSVKRSKEVGVRKVMGATRLQLLEQFLGETGMLVFLSVLLGVMATVISLPGISRWLDVQLDAGQLKDYSVILLVGTISVVIVLLAGLYPAFVQSAFNPVDSLKRKTSMSFRGINLRKGLVLFQFAISQILIVGTLVVAHQMNFFQNEDLGFNKEAVVSFAIPDGKKRDVLLDQLHDQPGISDICASSGSPASFDGAAGFAAPSLGITKDDVTGVKFIDDHFMDMYGLTLLAGEKISRKYQKDSIVKIVVNETMVSKLGLKKSEDAIGKRILFWGMTADVIGVVKDFQNESKHKKRRPVILLYNADNFYNASIRIRTGTIHKTIASVGKLWSALFPDQVFEYEFIDDQIAGWYKQEAKVYTAFKLFSTLAIIIGCLGLYGLVTFAAVQRTREVGIRKVLGASMFDISTLFAKEFVILIVLAFFVAAPVAYYFMYSWLENFAYHVNIGNSTFIIAITVSFLIAAVTISFQAIKAALANPIVSLRTE